VFINPSFEEICVAHVINNKYNTAKAPGGNPDSKMSIASTAVKKNPTGFVNILRTRTLNLLATDPANTISTVSIHFVATGGYHKGVNGNIFPPATVPDRAAPGKGGAGFILLVMGCYSYPLGGVHSDPLAAPNCHRKNEFRNPLQT
jgi:hypothetical protein